MIRLGSTKRFIYLFVGRTAKVSCIPRSDRGSRLQQSQLRDTAWLLWSWRRHQTALIKEEEGIHVFDIGTKWEARCFPLCFCSSLARLSYAFLLQYLFLSSQVTFTWTYKYADPYALCIADTYKDGLKKEYSFHTLKKLYRVILNSELFVYSL